MGAAYRIPITWLADTQTTYGRKATACPTVDEPRGQAGTRFPHAWFQFRGQRRLTLPVGQFLCVRLLRTGGSRKAYGRVPWRNRLSLR